MIFFLDFLARWFERYAVSKEEFACTTKFEKTQTIIDIVSSLLSSFIAASSPGSNIHISVDLQAWHDVFIYESFMKR